MENDNIPLETHPFEPYVPAGSRVLIMGTFPPQPKRWAMDFYYPNRANDFWPMMGLIFFDDARALFVPGSKDFDLGRIKALLDAKGIAMSDTGYRIRRLANNASDKFLEIVEPVSLAPLLERMPGLRAIATTGQKAAETLAALTATPAPPMGQFAPGPRGMHLWRMPSTSRAYPLPLERKAAFYRTLFEDAGIL